MSLGAYKWAKAVENIPPLEKWLLVTIADFYNEEHGNAWPGRTTLCKQTGMSLRSISRITDSLENRGLIRIQFWIRSSNGQNLNNRYFLPQYDQVAAARDTRKSIQVDADFNSDKGKVSFIDEYREGSA